MNFKDKQITKILSELNPYLEDDDRYVFLLSISKRIVKSINSKVYMAIDATDKEIGDAKGTFTKLLYSCLDDFLHFKSEDEIDFSIDEDLIMSTVELRRKIKKNGASPIDNILKDSIKLEVINRFLTKNNNYEASK